MPRDRDGRFVPELIKTGQPRTDGMEDSILGLQVGVDEVNIGFVGDDFETSEALLRETIKGTKFECIRTITRSEFGTQDYI